MTTHAQFNPNLRTEPMKTRSDLPASVLMMSTILYAIFAFVVTIVALNVFPVGGFVLALVLGWRGGFIPGMAGGSSSSQAARAVSPQVPATATRPSGNASFDAYRHDMLNRLEVEQDNFERFLGRLRDAKDKSEFDRFMDERARKAQPIRNDRDAGFDSIGGMSD